MPSSFGQIRSKILYIQGQVSGKLSHYSTFASAPGSTASQDELQTSATIEKQLGELSNLVSSLDQIANSDSSISTSKLQQLARHKETLNQYRIDYNRIQSTIQDERNRINLLSNVRSEIQDRRKQAQRSDDEGPEDSEGYLMDERMRVNRQHGVLDRLLEQVSDTRDEILRQRGSFRTMASKLQQSLGTMPGINVLMSKINTRRKRNVFILASVIVLCLIALWFLS